MTAAELYARGEYILAGIGSLSGCYFDHLPEVGVEIQTLPDEAERIEVRVVAEEWEDHRRFHRVATIWYDDPGFGELRPVMVVTNGGREGDDWARRYVTDHPLLLKMTAYLNSLAKPGAAEDDKTQLVELDEDVPEMTRFYNWDAFAPRQVPRRVI